MNKKELEQLVGGSDLEGVLDVKTLVLDIVRDMKQEEIMKIFWDKLPSLSAEFVRDYFYMKRG